MSASRERRATLTVFGAPPTPATAVLVSQSLGQRLARAVGVLVACWAVAIVAIFIPLAHFFLVPGFLVLGVVWAALRGRERERLLRLRGTCPRCGREAEFVPGGPQGRQTAVDCPRCFTRLVVTVEPPATPGAAPAAAEPPAPHVRRA
jgi:hypothetical protein